MRFITFLAAGLCLSVAMPAAAQRVAATAMRFQDMDRNRDGIITRNEWRGNDRTFRNHDWNGDGQLSGDEVRIGGPAAKRSDEFDIPGSIDGDVDWTPVHFRSLDHNGDGRLARSEWHASSEMFSRIDRNRDGFISAAEFSGGDADDDREDRFADLDTDRDGRLSRSEWHGAAAVFNALDANHDGFLNRAEAVGTEGGAQDEFKSVDVNGDGGIGRDEWHWNVAAFERLDANHDGRLSRAEFEAPPAASPAQTPVYRAGYERGRQEGLQAGREDKPRGWDLEGQRELETADSGYQSHLGDRAGYQAGYRAGFRSGYKEGFGPR